MIPHGFPPPSKNVALETSILFLGHSLKEIAQRKEKNYVHIHINCSFI